MSGDEADHDAPSRWIVRFAGAIARGGTVLDVACGAGRHARWLEARGHRVTGIDRDGAALARCGASETIVCDLEAGVAWPLAGRRFAAVVVARYLHRPLFPALLAALDHDGVLLYETFAVGHERFGRPTNPDFLLEHGELLRHCASLDVVAYEDGSLGEPPVAVMQRICAVAPGARSTGGRHHRL